MAEQRFSEFDLLKDDYFIKWITEPDSANVAYWQRWLIQNPDKAEAVERAREIVQSLQLKSGYTMEQGRYHQILDHVLRYQHKKQLSRRTYTLSSSSATYSWAIAAAVILLLVFSGVLILSRFLPAQEENLPATAQLITKDVPAGSKYTLKLPDGTLVKLNSESKIIYPEFFSDSIRLVQLEGEAFFEVDRDEQRPFVIESGNSKTTVLGTSFNVKAYAENQVEVAVITGKVKIQNRLGKEQVLAPYEMGIITSESEIFLKTGFDLKEVLGWKEGILLFQKADFEEVRNKLSRWYGVKFVVAPDLEVAGVYSGEYRNEALEDVLDGIAYSSGFRFEIQNETVYLYRQDN